MLCILAENNKVKPQVRLQEELLFPNSETAVSIYSSHLKSAASNHD